MEMRRPGDREVREDRRLGRMYYYTGCQGRRDTVILKRAERSLERWLTLSR